jgi:hypothetical protein
MLERLRSLGLELIEVRVTVPERFPDAPT